jgi:hypothetical protein
VDSNEVSRAIKCRIWPILSDLGFSKFTSRRAWKLHEHSSEVIYFQSFSSYLASGVGCTTFSFAVRCAVYYPSVHWLSLPTTEAPPFPKESMCPARLTLTKSIPQVELARGDIWYVRNDGSNLVEAVEDAQRAVQGQGIPWLNRLSDPGEAWRTFKERPSSAHEDFGGSVGSIARDHVLRGLKLVLDIQQHGAERGYESSSR